jgi:hypothetical protein
MTIAALQSERASDGVLRALVGFHQRTQMVAAVAPNQPHSNRQLRPRAAEAARYLVRLLDSGRAPEAASLPGLVGLLGRVVADGPGLPAAGAAMAALARLCAAPGGRARVRAEASLVPVVRCVASCLR